VSQENVEIVLALPHFRPGVDVVQLTRDADLSVEIARSAAPWFHEDFECVFPDLLGGGKTYTGFQGMRTAWLDWLAPWSSYRIEIQEGLDCGDRVLTFYDVFATPTGATGEVKLSGADVWTLRDGKITRWEGYPSRRAALKAAGLAE
jgi:ketosteroid isomerase-like protein